MAVDGKWNVKVKTPMGDQDVTLDFTTSGSTLTGTMSNGAGAVPIEDGKVDGDKVSWRARITVPLPLTVDCTGTVEGDTISGTASTSFGGSPFSGKRA
jgi:hypothetical protein